MKSNQREQRTDQESDKAQTWKTKIDKGAIFLVIETKSAPKAQSQKQKKNTFLYNSYANTIGLNYPTKQKKKESQCTVNNYDTYKAMKLYPRSMSSCTEYICEAQILMFCLPSAL